MNTKKFDIVIRIIVTIGLLAALLGGYYAFVVNQ